MKFFRHRPRDDHETVTNDPKETTESNDGRKDEVNDDVRMIVDVLIFQVRRGHVLIATRGHCPLHSDVFQLSHHCEGSGCLS